MIVAHLDLDAFYAAVEELEDPTLKEKPLVVGGDPHGRGVVADPGELGRRRRRPVPAISLWITDERLDDSQPVPGRPLDVRRLLAQQPVDR